MLNVDLPWKVPNRVRFSPHGVPHRSWVNCTDRQWFDKCNLLGAAPLGSERRMNLGELDVQVKTLFLRAVLTSSACIGPCLSVVESLPAVGPGQAVMDQVLMQNRHA